MKFDIAIGNPPYRGREALHQQFFNISVSIIKDNGYVSFIQPATTYFNKKNNNKDAVNKMIDFIIKYNTIVVIKNSLIFENAGLQTDVSITFLQKTPSKSACIQAITYKNGNMYYDISLSDVSFTQLPPLMFRNIKQKYEKFIKTNGSVEDRISRNTNIKKLALPKIRGHETSNADFFTLFSNQPKYKEIHIQKQNSDFGIVTNTGTINEYRNIFNYLESVMARFGLAMIKYNQHIDSKELALIPWLSDFNKNYTNDELYDMVKLSKIEIQHMEFVISDYYNRQ